jgi:Tol biopolymer transport system component
VIGNQSAPAWSSDGTRLVFTQARDGDTTGASQFYLTDASGSAPQLVDTGCVAPCVSDTDAAFSRDGTRLVFVRSLALAPTPDRPGPGKTPGPTPASVLATIDLVTGHVIELASTMIIDCPMLTGQHSPGVPNCEGLQNRAPGWSADGTQIVFTQDIPFDMNDRSMYGDFPPPPGPALFVVDADGRDLHQVSPRGSGDWSPDGARIVFQTTLYHDIVPNAGKGNGYTYTPSSDINTIRPDGTDLRKLTSDGNSARPSWTADGRIWFVRERQLWIMDADGGNARQVSVSPQVPLWYVPGRPPMP